MGQEGVENASCEFDVETLRPTYRLLIGIPGKSNAFAISQKLGLSEGIIGAARELLSSAEIKFEDVLADLEISRKSMEIERERAEGFRAEAERLRTETANQRDKLAAQRDKIIQTARREARGIVQQAKDEADALLRELRKSAKPARLGEAEAIRGKLGETLKRAQAQEASEAKRPKGEGILNPKRGDGVYIESLGQYGSIVGTPDSSGQVLVQVGAMKLKLPLGDLSRADTQDAPEPKQQRASQPSFKLKRESVPMEVNLLGCNVEEALERADKYLDDAYLSGFHQARIIHGKGTGTLKAAIHNYLRSHPLAASYRLGGQGEGDTGVTIVEFVRTN